MLGLQQLLSKGRPAPASESDSDSDSTSAAQVAEQKPELEQEVVEQGESDQGEEMRIKLCRVVPGNGVPMQMLNLFFGLLLPSGPGGPGLLHRMPN